MITSQGSQQSSQAITKRAKVGAAWFKRKKVRYVSGFITPEGLDLMNRIYKATGRRVNFTVLPNPEEGGPPLLVFVPYWSRG